MRLGTKLSGWFEGYRLLDLWRAFREHQQRKAFDRLLMRIPRGNDVDERRAAGIWAHHTRRKLSARPRVVGLGHMAWEKHGLWPSFERLTDFTFIPIGPDGGEWNEASKVQSGSAILSSIDALDRERPVEVVFIYADAFFVDEELLKALSERGIWTVMMGLDDKHKFIARREYGFVSGQSVIAPLVDLYWTTWKAGVPLFRQRGASPIYLAEGADPAFHRQINLKKDIDVLFLGACYGARRSLVAYLRSQGVNVEAYGKGWPNGFVSFEKTVELINRAKVVLGIGGVGYLDGVQHLKGRDFEVPMCGAVYLTTYNPELADWFEIGREILCYSSPQNCVEVLRWILADSEKQQRIRAAALLRCLNEHTWEHRIRAMLEALIKRSIHCQLI